MYTWVAERRRVVKYVYGERGEVKKTVILIPYFVLIMQA